MNLSGLVMIFLILVGFLAILVFSLMVVGTIIYCRKKGFKISVVKIAGIGLVSLTLLHFTGVTKLIHEFFFTILWVIITGS